MILSALNSSRTSFASFKLDRQAFFDDYSFSAPVIKTFGCQVFNKAFFSIFKTRGVDVRDQETGIERCDISLHGDGEETECRLIAKLTCLHGKPPIARRSPAIAMD